MYTYKSGSIFSADALSLRVRNMQNIMHTQNLYDIYTHIYICMSTQNSYSI